MTSPVPPFNVRRDLDAALKFNDRRAFQRIQRGSPVSFLLAVGDETTSITTGTAKLTWRAPFAFHLTEVRAYVKTAPTGASVIVDLNLAGTTLMPVTKLSIDATEKTSVTAAVPAVLAVKAIPNDGEVTVDIDQIGSTGAGAGVKVWLLGTRD